MMLMAIVVYMYTVIAFNFFRKFYASEEDGEVEQNCHDLFTVKLIRKLIKYSFKIKFYI